MLEIKQQLALVVAVWATGVGEKKAHYFLVHIGCSLVSIQIA